MFLLPTAWVQVFEYAPEQLFVNGLKAHKRMETDDVGMGIWRVAEVGRMKRRGSSYQYCSTNVLVTQMGFGKGERREQGAGNGE